MSRRAGRPGRAQLLAKKGRIVGGVGCPPNCRTSGKLRRSTGKLRGSSDPSKLFRKMLHFGKILKQFSETGLRSHPATLTIRTAAMAAATKRMRCDRGRKPWRGASVAPRGDTYPRPPSGEDRAPLHGGVTAEGPIRKWLRWGVRLIRSRSPLSLLVRERRATGASPSAPRQEVKNRARWVGRNKRRRALGAGSSRILRHPRTLRRGVEHRRAAA